MTLVQVKRPDRRPDTAEVIPTVTREVDDEGVTKAYRGGDAPTGEKDLVRRQQDLAATNPAAAGAIIARTERRPAPGARQRRSGCSGARPVIPSGDPRQGLVAPARRGGDEPRKGFLTACQAGSGGGRRRATEGLDVRRPYVAVGAEHVLRLDSADGSLARAPFPTPPLPTERLSAGCRSEAGPEGRAALPGLTAHHCPEETRPDLRQSETADESACTPGSVTRSPRGGRGDGHPSRAGIAVGLVRSTRELGRAALERSRRTVLRRPLLTLLRVGFT